MISETFPVGSACTADGPLAAHLLAQRGASAHTIRTLPKADLRRSHDAPIRRRNGRFPRAQIRPAADARRHSTFRPVRHFRQTLRLHPGHAGLRSGVFCRGRAEPALPGSPSCALAGAALPGAGGACPERHAADRPLRHLLHGHSVGRRGRGHLGLCLLSGLHDPVRGAGLSGKSPAGANTPACFWSVAV